MPIMRPPMPPVMFIAHDQHYRNYCRENSTVETIAAISCILLITVAVIVVAGVLINVIFFD